MTLLGEAVFARARAEGWGMTFEQAGDYVLETEPVCLAQVPAGGSSCATGKPFLFQIGVRD